VSHVEQARGRNRKKKKQKNKQGRWEKKERRKKIDLLGKGVCDRLAKQGNGKICRLVWGRKRHEKGQCHRGDHPGQGKVTHIAWGRVDGGGVRTGTGTKRRCRSQGAEG